MESLIDASLEAEGGKEEQEESENTVS